MLIPVIQSELPRMWDTLLPYLKLSFKRSPIPIPESKVYYAIASDEMRLFMITKDGSLHGACILRVEDHFDIKVLNIYALSHDRHFTGQEVCFQQAEEIATALGCQYLIGYGRRGFSKQSPQWGFKHVQTVMARKVGG